MDEVLTPADAGGTPSVVPSNAWWNFGGKLVDAVTNIELAKVRNSGLAPSNAPNRPPGGGGINPAAASTPGGFPMLSRTVDAFGAASPLTWVALVVAIALAFAIAKKI